MRAILFSILLIGLAGCNARATAPGGESAEDAMVEASLGTARMLVQSGAYGEAEEALRPAAHGPMLTQFSAARRREVIDLYAMSSWFGGDYAEAHWAYELATQDSAASSDDWQGRLMSAETVGDGRDSYVAFDHLRQSAPDQVRVIAPRLLQMVANDFRTLDNAGQAQLQLAEILSEGVRDDPRGELSPLWLHAAAAALQTGDQEVAAKYARRIDDPAVMVELLADRRFDALVAADPKAFDPHTLAERNLAQAEAAMAAPAGHLVATYKQATALYQLERYGEAVQAIDDGLAVGPAWGDDPSFQISLVARKATMLSKLGRDPEAIAMTQAQCAMCSGGGFELQEAHLLLGAGRPAEALRILQNIRGAPTGQTVDEVRGMSACAYHGAGHDSDVAPLLAQLKADLRRNPDAAFGGLLCVGSDADLVTALETMLADPETRPEALGMLQTYNEGTLPPLTSALRQRLARIIATSDVKAAIARVGRIGVYDTPRYAIIG